MDTKDIAPGLQLARVLSITGTAFLAGKAFSQSYSTTPSFLLAPAPLLAKQWKRMFDSDKLFAPLIALLSGSVFGVFAYRAPSLSTSKGTLYALASALALTSLPYSHLLLHPLNNKLEAKAAAYARTTITDTDVESSVKREETVHYLVDQWATVNLGRAVLAAAAALLATCAPAT